MKKLDTTKLDKKTKDKYEDSLVDNIIKSFSKLHLKDLLFTKNESTFQIDNILITNKACYIIETKCYNSVIKGDESMEFFKCYAHGSDKEFEIYNPVLVNRKHVEYIINNLFIDKSTIYSIVTIDDTNMKDLITGYHREFEMGVREYIVYHDRLKDLINDIENFIKVECYTNDHIKKLKNIINTISHKDKKTILKHKAQVKEKIKVLDKRHNES